MFSELQIKSINEASSKNELKPPQSKFHNRSRQKSFLKTTGQQTLDALSPISPQHVSTGSIPSRYQRVVFKKDPPLMKGAGSKSRSPPRKHLSASPSIEQIKSKLLSPQHSSMLSKLSNEDQSELLVIMKTMLENDEHSKTGYSTYTTTNTDPSSLIQQQNAPFGSSASRFDPSYDCQLLFNLQPGPGSYKTNKEIELPDIDTDTLITLGELKRRLNTESAMLDTLYLKENISSLSKLQHFFSSHQKNKAQNELEGIKFPMAPRFPQPLNPTPGPSDYQINAPDKVKCGVVMTNDQKIKLPNSIAKNPLSYVRPLIVNLYYKTPNPGVGAYDVIHPNDMQTTLDNPKKQSYKSTFDSKQDRFGQIFNGDKEIVLTEKENDYYDVIKSKSALEQVKYKMPSSSFAKPVVDVPPVGRLPPLIIEIVSKEPYDNDTIDMSVYHKTIEESVSKAREQYYNYQQSGNENTHDRFGQPILPRRVSDDLPGPGEYNSVKLEKIRRTSNRTTIINPVSVMRTPPLSPKAQETPGPAAYDTRLKGQSSVSYHFWMGDPTRSKKPWIQ